jgi:thiol-disulfide isomerase/thioredoxin
MKRSLLALLIITAMAGTASATKPGDREIDFSLKDLNGKTVKLSSLKGKVVILDFWASWCGPCKKELPALDAVAAKYKADKKDIVILAVNIDKDKKKAQEFLKSVKIGSVTVVLDPSGGAATQYDLPTMPSSFVIDKKGIVRFTYEGFNAGDEKKVAGDAEGLL